MASYKSEYIDNTERKKLYRQSAKMEHAKGTSKRSPYLISVAMQVKALMKRRVQIMRGDKLTVIMNLV